ncbi:translation initiation factor IF-2 [Eubalaena glacialis]|uniref:translation initiation factor IF-2 n=1 Tax=Eubalaena glacialis TaxID=27606 RepID=UPI002A59B89B|nr:translation initiation factor IF-2 [Eubalaena glacialis]
MRTTVRHPWLYRCSESNRYPGMINKQAHRGLQVTCSRPREQMQPKSKGHSRSQLGRRALSSSGRRRSHLPLGDPQPPPGRTQKQSRKSHLGTCVTLTCSYSPGPGEPRSPCKFGIVAPGPLTLPRCAAQSAGGRFPAAGLRSRVGAAAAAASAGGAARISSPPLAPTSGRGTAAGRELSPERPPGCCSAALGRPLPGPEPGSSREAAPGCMYQHELMDQWIMSVKEQEQKEASSLVEKDILWCQR